MHAIFQALTEHGVYKDRYVGQGIQEWTTYNLWKTGFKKILLHPFLNTLTHITKIEPIYFDFTFYYTHEASCSIIWQQKVVIQITSDNVTLTKKKPTTCTINKQWL